MKTVFCFTSVGLILDIVGAFFLAKSNLFIESIVPLVKDTWTPPPGQKIKLTTWDRYVRWFAKSTGLTCENKKLEGKCGILGISLLILGFVLQLIAQIISLIVN